VEDFIPAFAVVYRRMQPWKNY